MKNRLPGVKGGYIATVDFSGCSPTSPCLKWPGKISQYGYGRASYRGKVWFAHRAAYTIVRGDIPRGMTLDHLCRTRECFNPWHLEVTTVGENVLRGEGFAAVNRTKTHCPKGHPLSGANCVLITNRKGRQGRTCRQCATARAKSERGKAYRRAYYQRNRDRLRKYHREWMREKHGVVRPYIID